MEGVLAALAFLVIAACCGVPILVLGVVRLFYKTKKGQRELPSMSKEPVLKANDSDLGAGL